MSGKPNNLQDIFLNQLRRERVPVTMFLVKGVKLQGLITWFDNFSVLLRRDGQSQLVYKHAISTILPAHSFDASTVREAFGEGPADARMLQELFLAAVQRSEEPVTMFLVNGVMLQGDVAAYDLFCVLLERDGAVQLVYKHAISTVQPNGQINLLADARQGEDDGSEA